MISLWAKAGGKWHNNLSFNLTAFNIIFEKVSKLFNLLRQCTSSLTQLFCFWYVLCAKFPKGLGRVVYDLLFFLVTWSKSAQRCEWPIQWVKTSNCCYFFTLNKCFRSCLLSCMKHLKCSFSLQISRIRGQQ